MDETVVAVVVGVVEGGDGHQSFHLLVDDDDLDGDGHDGLGEIDNFEFCVRHRRRHRA